MKRKTFIVRSEWEQGSYTKSELHIVVAMSPSFRGEQGSYLADHLITADQVIPD